MKVEPGARWVWNAQTVPSAKAAASPWSCPASTGRSPSASSTARLDGRPYSSIETSLVRRMLDLVLVDTEDEVELEVVVVTQAPR